MAEETNLPWDNPRSVNLLGFKCVFLVTRLADKHNSRFEDHVDEARWEGVCKFADVVSQVGGEPVFYDAKAEGSTGPVYYSDISFCHWKCTGLGVMIFESDAHPIAGWSEIGYVKEVRVYAFTLPSRQRVLSVLDSVCARSIPRCRMASSLTW